MVFFFFQAEDGIRDYKVTGVQTCALPIYELCLVAPFEQVGDQDEQRTLGLLDKLLAVADRSEERRVGKECRARWWTKHEKKKRSRHKERGQGTGDRRGVEER